MNFSQLKRFQNDINYDIIVSPYGYEYRKMSKKIAQENFEWFLSIIPERMQYLRKRISEDLNISIDSLDYSPESLILVWRWFLQIARLEKTPKEILQKMEDAAKVFGDSFINKKQFTVVTQFIMKDVGAYIGQTYLLNNHELQWSFYTKPKNEIDVNQPIIEGFYYKDQITEGKLTLNPLSFAEGAAQNFYTKTQAETDVYDYYLEWEKFIPDRASCENE